MGDYLKTADTVSNKRNAYQINQNFIDPNEVKQQRVFSLIK